MTNQKKPAQPREWRLFSGNDRKYHGPNDFGLSILVVEYSAFESVCAERDKLKKKYETAFLDCAIQSAMKEKLFKQYQELMVWAEKLCLSSCESEFQQNKAAFDRWKEGGK